MARAAMSRQTIAKTGLNLTDATFTTMTLGAGNGVEVPYVRGLILVLKNDTGGAATFTIKVATPAESSNFGSTYGDISRSVADGKTWLVPVNQISKQADGDVYVDCSVAGKIAALVLP